MKAPDYRAAACCLHCWHLTGLSARCMKHSDKVDICAVCADFITKKEVEGETCDE